MTNNKNLKKTISIQAAIAAVVLSATFFLILLENFKTYKATSNVMVITKSEFANSQQEKIIGNIAMLPTNLSFYDRLLKNNPEIKDFTEGKNADERKRLWNDKIKVKESKEGSFISISYEADDAAQAKQINTKIVRNLFDSVSVYYNVKDDVDVRLVDGPVVSSDINYWYLLLLVSISLGYSIAYLMDRALKYAEVYFHSKTSKSKVEQNIVSLNEKESSAGGSANQVNERIEIIGSNVNTRAESQDDALSTRDEELEKLNEIIQQDIYPNFPEMPISQPRKASAPDNLPIADSSFFMTEPQQPEENLEAEETPVTEEKSEPEQEIKLEPTPEELKKRLNELLRGGK